MTRASWTAWGVTATVTVADPDHLAVARRVVAQHLGAIEAVAARRRPDAEVHRLYRLGGQALTVSPLLAEVIAASLLTAERTGGDVAPTISAALTAQTAAGRAVPPAAGGAGHPAAARDVSMIPVCSAPVRGARPAPGWEQVELRGRRLRVPAGVTLDLTATAKALACDRAAAAAAQRLGDGVLVQFGGDAATAGPAPQDGWPVPIHGRDGRLQTIVRLAPGAAIATSYLDPRDDDFGDGAAPHLIDPRTGRPPARIWQQASVVGFSCLEASAYTAASLVRGISARDWLTQLWVAARLVTVAGDVITAGPGDTFTPSTAARRPSHDPSVPGPRLAHLRRKTLR